MSAVFDDTERAVFGEALIQEAVDKLAGWLAKDHAIVPGSDASTSAEWLTLYYLFVIAGRRRGLRGMSFLLEAAEAMPTAIGGEE
ncbi:MAG TPA: hypothetical protein VGC09_02885 [Rhodopila sp.]